MLTPMLGANLGFAMLKDKLLVDFLAVDWHRPFLVGLTCGVLALCCMSCVSHNRGGDVKMHPSPNFNERKCPVSMIVIHYTAIPTCEEALARLCDTTNKAGRVSAHYLVDRDGSVYGLVDEARRAWHAGAGKWRDVTDVNSASVGIELVNVGLTEDGRRECYPNAQMEALISLCKDIQSRYGIQFDLGHSDVAPARKQDPGEAFDWKRLARAGIGVWTDEFGESGDALENVHSGIGYDVTDLKAAVIAFQRHFYPEGLASDDSGEMTRKRAAPLIRRCARNFDLL